ncbi:MAG: SDR family oxidoreductase, partial [Nitrospinae bacterium]|nr:SDR family oxidoreductase [Nitrospinota bacterium]
YLVGVLEIPGLESRIYHIGGKDVMSYKDLILKFADILKRRVHFFSVSWVVLPVEWMCRLYACWLHLFISVPVNITTLLLSSLRSDVFCREKDITKILPFEPLDFQTAVEWAQEKEEQSRVFSHWSDVPPEKMKDLLPLCEFEAADFEIAEHSIEIPASPEKIFPVICRIGGENGWAHANFLWEIRGLIDRVIGGVGLHRGRRDAQQLRVGDAVDFWRVEKLEPGRELLLRAEMISPGLSWLQFELEPVAGSGVSRHGENTRVILRAHFIPKPFWGYLYWASLSKFHTYIFKGMLESFRREAIQAEHIPQPFPEGT